MSLADGQTDGRQYQYHTVSQSYIVRCNTISYACALSLLCLFFSDLKQLFFDMAIRERGYFYDSKDRMYVYLQQAHTVYRAEDQIQRQ